jgi:AraC-like DNA-binding protein
MPGTTAEVPIERAEFLTRSHDEASEFIARRFIGHRARPGRPTENGQFRGESAMLGTLGLDWCRISMPFETTTDPFDYLFLPRVTRGRLRITTSGEDRKFTAGDVCLYPPAQPLTCSWDEIDHVALRLPIDPVAELAESSSGIGPATLRFASMAPISPAMGRYFASVSQLVTGELLAPEADGVHPLVAEQLTAHVAAAVLAVFPNTTMTTEQLPGPGHVGAAALRQALEFIEAHAGEPITLTDIATAAGTGARALQYGFARRHHTSPMGYLQRVRLARAHADLQAADPTSGATVRGIAAAWGFANPGRFAVKYRQAYGQAPSQTLRG